jgi:hypothetical protein
MRKPKQKSNIIRRPAFTYNNKEERERKNEDRKFVIVVAELVNIDTPTEVHELMGEPDRANMPRECDSELPRDAMLHQVELSYNEDKTQEDLASVIFGIAELPVPVELPAESVEKTGLDDS